MLLRKNEAKRIGSKAGASEIKNHPWFAKDIQWALLRNTTPPIIPKVDNPTDTKHFRDLKEDKEMDLEKEAVGGNQSGDLAKTGPALAVADEPNATKSTATVEPIKLSASADNNTKTKEADSWKKKKTDPFQEFSAVSIIHKSS